MSIPRNHHFVSQVHIENFFNSKKGKIFLYDKRLNNYFFRTTTKSVFSEKDLNSKFVDGDIDHISLEEDLNKFFEKDFSKKLEIVRSFITDFNLTKEVNDALIYFAKYGVIGEIRTPRNKRNIEGTIDKVFSEIYEIFTDGLKKEFDNASTYKQKVNYINAVQYSEYANETIELMGDLIFRIEIPKNDNDYFLLPDFCAANRREKINTYFNPGLKEIAYIGIPLTSKIYIHFYSSKIEKIKLKSGMQELDRVSVNSLNKMNYEFCESKVSCENEEYLNYFIENVARKRKYDSQ